MLPTDVEYGSPRLKTYNEKNNDATRKDVLDQLEEAHDVALLHSARYQQSLRRYHDRHVRRRDLNVGDLVLRQSQNTKGGHKLYATMGRVIHHRRSVEAQHLQTIEQER
jgi:hypothetical protein